VPRTNIPDALTAAQPTVSKHERQFNNFYYFQYYYSVLGTFYIPPFLSVYEKLTVCRSLLMCCVQKASSICTHLWPCQSCTSYWRRRRANSACGL